MAHVRKLTSAGDLVLCMTDTRGGPECIRWLVDQMRDCPHVVNILPVKDDDERLLILFALPEESVWWVTMQSEKPEVIGARSVEVTFLKDPWPLDLYLPEALPEGAPPCGANCPKCPQYRSKCSGCPGSSFKIPHPNR